MVIARVPAASYIVVGDSTAHRFDGIVVEHPSGPAVLKARWQPMSHIADVFRDAKLSEYLTRILMEMRFVKRTDDRNWPFPPLREHVDGTGPEFCYEPRNAARCVLLFSYGESDLFQMTPEYASGHFDEQAAFDAVGRRFQPLFDAIRTLRSIGYANVFLHGITPPTKRDVPWGSYSVRLNLARIGHAVFERFADETGVGLISIWDDVFSPDEGRDPRYARDDLHLNAESAVLSSQRLCEQLEWRGFYEVIAGAQPEYPNSSMSCA